MHKEEQIFSLIINTDANPKGLTQFLILPFERRTPSSLLEFLEKDTRKSTGISFAPGGL